MLFPKLQRLILQCQYAQRIRTLIRGHRAYWWDFFTATNMAGKATHFTHDALTSKAHHQWRAVTALCRRRKCPYKELVRFGFGGEMRGQMRGFIMQVESMQNSRILWNNHIQINSNIKINSLSQQLISKEYNGSVAHWNTQNSVLHESILYQKKHISEKAYYIRKSTYQEKHIISKKAYYIRKSTLYHKKHIISEKAHYIRKSTLYQKKHIISEKAYYIRKSILYQKKHIISEKAHYIRNYWSLFISWTLPAL